MGWASDEFKDVDLGDKRLDERLVNMCDTFSESPESSINHACEDWGETKASYRFFQNDNVDVDKIIKAHRVKTFERSSKHETVLAIQDTSYIMYTNHPKTKGLCKISTRSKKSDADRKYAKGLVMHACLAVTTKGTPLGLLDQNIYARKTRSEVKAKTQDERNITVEEKDSYRWIKSMANYQNFSSTTNVVTVCDRECDFYEFFKSAEEMNSAVLIRAAQNRTVNKKSKCARVNAVKLWDHIKSQQEIGSYVLDIPRVKKSKTTAGRTARSAKMSVKFGEFKMNPPKSMPKHNKESLPDIKMWAIYVLEIDPPAGEEPVEWMLLTNIPISTMEQAQEKVYWYSLRWRIEMYFKVVKSGFKVEKCRLGTADRLIRYLTVMSVVAWRLFMITLIGRTNPSLSCAGFLSESEWKTLNVKYSKNHHSSTMPPTIGEAVVLIARLGGYLDRRSDPPPGTITLWRGWKRLVDLTEGWELATTINTCG
jgi:hypothetical protein